MVVYNNKNQEYQHDSFGFCGFWDMLKESISLFLLWTLKWEYDKNGESSDSINIDALITSDLLVTIASTKVMDDDRLDISRNIQEWASLCLGLHLASYEVMVDDILWLVVGCLDYIIWNNCSYIMEKNKTTSIVNGRN